ncbi:uncharacterized protein LOC135979802, partial [Chrysemys picta bellii]|uniref:uncharacterized protein LOC135979802 n=1 Tax=Chrysemys picta bellii TaxID=8478 RepID=UPI0032B2CA89
MHLEKLPLAHTLRIAERRIEYVARHLDEVLIPPSVTTSAASQFSYSSMESIPSSLWSHSSFSLAEASVTQSEPLCRTREITPVAGWEGSTHPIQAQPLPRPPAHSRQDRREQTTGLDQTSAHGSDFNIRQKHLQSQLGAPTLSTESLAKVIPNAPALRPPDRDPRVKFNMSRGLFLSVEVREELDCHVHSKRLQHEQGLPLTPQKPHTAPLPPAPQTPILGEPLLGERDTKRQWEFNTDRPKCGFTAKVPTPLRSDAGPQHAQEIQEPCVCLSGSLPQKAHRIMASPDAIMARLVPTAVVKLQEHVAQKCLEIQMKVFPKMVGESHRDSPLLKETALPGPLRPPREPGKPRTAALPTMGQQPAHPIKLHIRRKHLVMQWGLLTLDPEPPAKVPHTVPAKGAGVEFSEMETDFLLDEVREKLDWHTQWKKLQQEWGLPDAQWKSLRAFLPPVPKLSSLKAKPKAAHDLQIKHLMEMLSSSRPLAGQVSVCQLCRKAHPGKEKGQKTQEETQVSAELHGLRDITAPHGFDGTVTSKLSRDQPPIRVCKCDKVRRKRPAGSAGADLPRRSHGIPQRWTPGDSSASSNHNKLPVVWLLPADRSKTQDGIGKTAPTKQPKMVSIAT